MFEFTRMHRISIANFAGSGPLNRRIRSLGIAVALAIASVSWAIPATAANPPDSWITVKTKMALLMAEDVSAPAVRVDTMDGKVTLYGTVSTAEEKARAERAARGVAGVVDVRNLLQVVEKKNQKSVAIDDKVIAKEVAKQIDADPALHDSKISVQSVNRGVVLLDGDAKTLTAHLRALEDARAVPGVTRVASEIESPDTLADDEIWRDAKSDSRTPGTSSAGDAWITTAAKVRLMANAATPAFDINVDTEGGVVTLFGTVPTKESRDQAAMEVKKIDGVKRVENDLQVVPHVSAAAVEGQDERAKFAIEKRMEAREDLADSSIDVEVANGVVRLTGTVRSQSDRLTALTLARTTDGVHSVIGDLTVKQ
jgi:osmotically-inducible protein OsmY